MEVPLIGPCLASVRRDHPRLDRRMLRLEAVRRMIGVMVDDLMTETRARAASEGVASADDVRAMNRALVAFSDGLADDLAKLRAFPARADVPALSREPDPQRRSADPARAVRAVHGRT
jgi:dGTPase